VSAGGWIFMGVAWAAATGLVVWCYARIVLDDLARRR